MYSLLILINVNRARALYHTHTYGKQKVIAIIECVMSETLNKIKC